MCEPVSTSIHCLSSSSSADSDSRDGHPEITNRKIQSIEVEHTLQLENKSSIKLTFIKTSSTKLIQYTDENKLV